MDLKSRICDRNGPTALVLSRAVELVLYLSVGAILIGHVINRLTSPEPLNPLWNRMSTFAASGYGGDEVTAGIFLFAFDILLFGILSWVTSGGGFIARAGGMIMAISSIPVAFIATFPISTPRGETVAKRESFLRWLEHQWDPAMTERMSQHLHNVSLGFAFTLILAGMVLLNLAFLTAPRLRRVGQAGLLLTPILLFFLRMTYNAPYYNGTWQRAAFVCLILWIWFANRRLGEPIAGRVA
jgi:hypothetical protein